MSAKGEQQSLLAESETRAPAQEFEGREEATTGLRLKRAQREQRRLVTQSLDDELEKDHLARLIWAMTGELELSSIYRKIGSRGSNAGAPAIDPRITLVLWIYATIKGEGSAREIARLCEEHVAYRWIRGGVPVRAHHLSDFRSANGHVFCNLITQVVAVLLKNGLCDLARYAQDGTRVRASAGAASFRREASLAELRVEAAKHLEEVLREGEDAGLSAVRRAARERGARDRLARVDAALAQLAEVQATKARHRDAAPPRVSTTDAEARVMKRGDGGFRPAYNAQFATTCDPAKVIVGVEVTNFGTDQGAAEPMLEQIEQRFGVKPTELLVDGGYLANDSLDALAAQDVLTYAPLKKAQPGQRPPEEPRASDSPAVAEWRARMQTPEAKEIYKQRAATAELVNADGKGHRGLDHVPIRSVEKAFSFVALFALSYNILRTISLLRGM